jgi:aminotransferase
MPDTLTTTPDLARRTRDLEQSDIRALTKKIDAAGGINLGQGICDLPTPPPIREGAKQAIADNKSIYTHYLGAPALREAILSKAQSYNDLPASSIDEVMVGVGATGCYVTAAHALLDPGDEVILLEPFYGYHRNVLALMEGVRIRYVPAEPPAWTPDFEALAATFSERTKAVVLNTPGNPSGKVWSRPEMERLLRLAERHDAYVLTDEIYEYMTYDGREHRSFGALPDAYERTVTISGFSKTFNMTGWRLGYAVGPAPIIEAMGLVNDLNYICAPAPLQHGVAEALPMDASYYENLQRDYAGRRRLLCEALEDAGFEFARPEGAYYVFAGFEELAGEREGFVDGQAASDTLIHEAGVAAIPGASFFEEPERGRYYLRFCFAKEIPVLRQACEQLHSAFA